jgi:hypothetical protein
MSDIEESFEEITEPEVEGQIDGGEAEKLGEKDEFSNFSDDEKKAYSEGWRPESGYDGDNWQTAYTFNSIKDQKDEIKKLKEQNERNSDLRRQFEELKTTVNSSNETSMDSLKMQAQEFFDNGDRENYNKVQKKIDKISESPKGDSRVPYEIQEWERNNPYINELSDKSDYAKEAFEQLNKNHPNATFSQKLKRLDEKVLAKFAGKKTKNPNRERPSTTSSRPSQGGRSSYAKFEQLPEAEKTKCRKGNIYNMRNDKSWREKTESVYLSEFNKKLQEKN